MDLLVTLHGSDTAHCLDLDVKVTVGRGSVIGTLARNILSECSGVPPESRLLIFRGDTPALPVKAISEWAAQTVYESDGVSVRFAEYKPYPKGDKDGDQKAG